MRGLLKPHSGAATRSCLTKAWVALKSRAWLSHFWTKTVKELLELIITPTPLRPRPWSGITPPAGRKGLTQPPSLLRRSAVSFTSSQYPTGLRRALRVGDWSPVCQDSCLRFTGVRGTWEPVETLPPFEGFVQPSILHKLPELPYIAA